MEGAAVGSAPCRRQHHTLSRAHTHTHVNVSPNGNTMWKDYVLEFGFFWNSFGSFCFFTIKTEEFEGKEHHFPLHQAINSFKLETWAEKIFLYFYTCLWFSSTVSSFGFRCCLASGSSSVWDRSRHARCAPVMSFPVWWLEQLTDQKTALRWGSPLTSWIKWWWGHRLTLFCLFISKTNPTGRIIINIIELTDWAAAVECNIA